MTKQSKNYEYFVDDNAAEQLLTIMLKDSAYEFEAGVEDYIVYEKQQRSARKKLEKAIDNSNNKEEIMECLHKYDGAVLGKQQALRVIKCEYLFLNGERDIKPPIDGEYVAHALVKKIIKNMEEEERNDLLFFLKSGLLDRS